MGIIQGFLRRFRRGQPVNQVADTTNLNRIANILEGIQGVGCRIEKPIDAEGRGWRIVVGDGSDLNPAETVTDSPTGQAHPEGGGGVDTNDYAWRIVRDGNVYNILSHGGVYDSEFGSYADYNTAIAPGIEYSSHIIIPTSQSYSSVAYEPHTLGILYTSHAHWCWAYSPYQHPLEADMPEYDATAAIVYWHPLYNGSRYLTQGDITIGVAGYIGHIGEYVNGRITTLIEYDAAANRLIVHYVRASVVMGRLCTDNVDRTYTVRLGD